MYYRTGQEGCTRVTPVPSQGRRIEILRPPWATEQIIGQPGLNRESLWQTGKQTRLLSQQLKWLSLRLASSKAAEVSGGALGSG